jgi:hypothetical protein
MVEFEPPKRRALSDAELHRAITLLGSSAEGLANSEQLISEQALLREQESQALSDWIKELQADGSPQALAALQKIALDVLPVNLEEVTPAELASVQTRAEPIFTTEIPIIRRKQRSQKNEVFRSLVPGFASWLVIALVNSLISKWLELSLLESVIAFGIGLVAAGMVLAVLKSHSLHPLLRSAAVFGGWGVYLGAALALAFTTLVVLGGVLHVAPDDLLIGLVPGYRSDVLIAALAAVILSQLVPRSWHWRLLLVSGLAAVVVASFATTPALSEVTWFAYAPLSGESFVPEPSLDWPQIGWASFAVGLMSIVLLSFAMPHRQTKAWSFFLQVPLGFGISVGLIFIGSSQQLSLVTLFTVLLATALSGRDLTGRAIGRLAAASFLIPVMALPVLDFVNGPAVSVLAALIVLLFADQLVRRTPLHIPSLDTSYGFYGSFQLVTWLGLLTAAPLGVDLIQNLLVPSSTFSVVELALIFGLTVGFTFALIRIFVIKAQDREIRNVEIRNMNLDNLLGL